MYVINRYPRRRVLNEIADEARLPLQTTDHGLPRAVIQFRQLDSLADYFVCL